MGIGQTLPESLDTCGVRAVDPVRIERARRSLLGDEVYFDLAETFRALADSSRAKIVYSLQGEELCVCDLAVVVGLSDSAVSQHLRVLRSLRLVKSRRDGKNVYYSLDDDHIRTLLQVCLKHVGHGEAEGEGTTAGRGDGGARSTPRPTE